MGSAVDIWDGLNKLGNVLECFRGSEFLLEISFYMRPFVIKLWSYCILKGINQIEFVACHRTEVKGVVY